jgi:hypothetical protein
MAHAGPFLSMLKKLRKVAGKTFARTGEFPEREKMSTQYSNDRGADFHLLQSVAIGFYQAPLEAHSRRSQWRWVSPGSSSCPASCRASTSLLELNRERRGWPGQVFSPAVTNFVFKQLAASSVDAARRLRRHRVAGVHAAYTEPSSIED